MKRPRLVSIIAAVARNGVIGRDNALPWRLPADLRHFKQTTMGKPVIMGRKTFESIGKPLPGRDNIVVTRQEGYRAEGCTVASSLEAALEAASGHDEAMIIGGRALYRDALTIADRLYLTCIDADIEGDTYFPAIVEGDWMVVSEKRLPKDEANSYPLTFRVMQRRHSS